MNSTRLKAFTYLKKIVVLRFSRIVSEDPTLAPPFERLSEIFDKFQVFLTRLFGFLLIGLNVALFRTYFE